MTDLFPSGVAPISPDEPFDEDAYDAMIAAMDEMIAEPELQEAFDPNQPRWPKGTPHGGKFRPKLATGGGLEGKLDEALKPIRDQLDDMAGQLDNLDQPGWVGLSNPKQLQKLGNQINDVAVRHSTVAAYTKRRLDLEDQWLALDDERYRNDRELDGFLIDPASKGNLINDWLDREGRNINAPEWTARRQEMLVKGGGLSDKLAEMQREITKLSNDEMRARQDAIVGVLSKIRPMGGKLNAEFEMHPVSSHFEPGDHEQHLREVMRMFPSDWIADMNRAGTTRFQVHENDIRAYHRDVPSAPQPGALTKEQEDGIAETIRLGGSYEGMYDGRYPVVRRPGTKEGGIGPYAPIYDWINEKGQQGNLQLPESGPPNYDESKWDRKAPQPSVSTGRDSIIAVSTNTPARTFLHEIMHRVQNVPSSRVVGRRAPDQATSAVRHRAEYNLLTERAPGSSGDPSQVAKLTKKLADVYPGAGYDDWEITIPDKWSHAYYGKVYGHYADASNELLTMASEEAFYSPWKLQREDPETYNWILGLLAAA